MTNVCLCRWQGGWVAGTGRPVYDCILPAEVRPVLWLSAPGHNRRFCRSERGRSQQQLQRFHDVFRCRDGSAKIGEQACWSSAVEEQGGTWGKWQMCICGFVLWSAAVWTMEYVTSVHCMNLGWCPQKRSDAAKINVKYRVIAIYREINVVLSWIASRYVRHACLRWQLVPDQ